MLDYKLLLEIQKKSKMYSKKILLATLITLIYFSSCRFIENGKINECGIKNFGSQGEVLFFVKCDSVSGDKHIYERIKEDEYISSYELAEFDIKNSYWNQKNKKIEFSTYYNDSLVFRVIRFPGYSNNKELEILEGSPIIYLSNYIEKKSEKRAFYISTPSFVKSNHLTTYKLKEDSMVVGQSDYSLKGKKILLELDELELYNWKIVISQQYNSGRNYKFEKLIKW